MVSSAWGFTITGTGATSAVMVAGHEALSYQVMGTFTADVEVEVSNTKDEPASGEWFSTATESAETLKALTDHPRWIRFNCTAYTSGTAEVRLNVVS